MQISIGKKTLLLVLLFILIGVNDVQQNQTTVKALIAPTIVFVNDDYSSLTPGWGYDHFDHVQDGIDAVAEQGTVYVYNGVFFENIEIRKSMNLVGESMYSTVISGVGTFTLQDNVRLKMENLSFKRKGTIWISKNSYLFMNHTKFILEQDFGEQYIIWVYGVMKVDNSNISSNQKSFYIHIAGKASLNNVIMPLFSRVYGWGFEKCIIDINNSKVGGINPNFPLAKMTVRDSEVLNQVDVDFLYASNGSMRITDLHPGYFKYWDLQKNITFYSDSSPGDLFLFNTTVRSFTVRPCGSHTTTLIENSDVELFRCDYGRNSLLILDNISTDLWYFHYFSNVIIKTKGEILINYPLIIYNSDFSLCGDTIFTIKSDVEVSEFNNSVVTRNYNISVMNPKSEPVENVLLKLYDKTGSIVWSGLTDVNGKATMNIQFDEKNFNEKFNLTAELNTIFGFSYITFLCNTPIVIIISENGSFNGPLLQLLHPNGGETLHGTITVKWSAFDTMDRYDLPIYLDYFDEDNYTHQIFNSFTNNGEYSWNTHTLPDGNYKLLLKTVDSDNNIGQDSSDWFQIKNHEEPPANHEPLKPDVPQGPANGKIKQEYQYTTSTTDPEGDNVYYLWDWGDGNNSGWIGPSNSDVTSQATHNWTVKGSYNIKVKAKDIYGLESDWATLTVTMPYLYNKPIQQFFELLFQRFPNAFPLLRQLLE